MFSRDDAELFCKGCLRYVGKQLSDAIKSDEYQPFAFETHAAHPLGAYEVKCNLTIYSGGDAVYELWVEYGGGTWGRAAASYSAKSSHTTFRWIEHFNSDDENMAVYLLLK